MRAFAVATLFATVMPPSDRAPGCGGASSEPVRVSWSESASVGELGVELVGCRDWTVEREAGAVVVDEGWDRCGLQAWRQDGRLRVESSVRWLDGEPGRVDFGLPSGPIGGVGIEFTPRAYGMHVERVLEGSPADRQGIRPGDRIVAVDGVPSRRLALQEFVRQVTGTPGSPVELRVQPASASPCHFAGAEAMTLVRERIP